MSKYKISDPKEIKNVYIKTFGCSLNQSDSELMAGLLQKAGYSVICDGAKFDSLKSDATNPEPEKFDIVIINSCTVKNHAEKKFFQEIEHWKKNGSKIIAAGCVPQADPEILQTRLKNIPVIGTRQLVHIVDIIDDMNHGKIVQNITNDYNERLNLPKIRKSGIIEILPISEGCLGYCSYCKTKMARGELLSYSKESIIAEFKKALDDGCKEFWITSQDNGCYGFDIYRKEKYFLAQLLKELLSLDGDFKIRLGMSNPDHIDRIKDDLIEVFAHPKMYKFLHIPVQSGNDNVLKLMKRSYSIKDFKNIVLAFRKSIPYIGISTDIIVGFPGEDEQAFDDSMRLLEWLKPDVLNLSRFWLRRGTQAEKLKQILGGISKKRSEQMRILFDRLSAEKNRKCIGQTHNAIIDEIGKNNSMIARNDYYKQIIIKNPEKPDSAKSRIGDYVTVKIVGSGTYDLIGEIVSVK